MRCSVRQTLAQNRSLVRETAVPAVGDRVRTHEDARPDSPVAPQSTSEGERMSDTKPYLATPEQGVAIWHMGALMQFRATSEQTGNQFWMAEQTSHFGYASP